MSSSLWSMRDQSVQDVLPSVRNSKVSFDIYHCDFCEILCSQENLNLVQWGKGPESTMSEEKYYEWGEVL